MKYVILGPRNNIMRVLDKPPIRPHIEISEEQAEKIIFFRQNERLAFLIDGQITNFMEQYSLGNSMEWNKTNNNWVITPNAIEQDSIE